MDRLTSLPVELVHMILQLVPIRDAVRTSALSRTWRYRWMYIPHLVFDSRSIPPPTEGRKNTMLVDFVNTVLFLHNAEVFRFSITNFKDWVSRHVDRWILVLGRKNVQELILHFSNCRVYKLPSSLFSCQNLRVLKLKHCLLSLPPCAKGFCNLVELHLDGVIFTAETIASLILNNPLKTLALHNCSGFTIVDIYAPNLCTFILHGPCERIHFGNTPVLEYAALGLLPCDSQSSVLRSNIRRNLEDALGDAIHAVEIFASKRFIEILAGCKVPERPRVSFYRMSCITFQINLGNSKEVSVALCLFRGSPCLDELEIISCANTQVMHLDEKRSSETQLHRKEDIFPILDTVELSEFKGTQAEMDFVSFVLLNAALLETMSVKWHVSCIHDNQRKALVLENMMQFKRASSNAQVLFVKPT